RGVQDLGRRDPFDQRLLRLPADRDVALLGFERPGAEGLLRGCRDSALSPCGRGLELDEIARVRLRPVAIRLRYERRATEAVVNRYSGRASAMARMASALNASVSMAASGLFVVSVTTCHSPAWSCSNQLKL